MQLGMIGLGRMGGGMVVRLMKAGHECRVFDSHPAAVQDLVAKGATGSSDLKEFVKGLAKPRAVWLMVPAAVVEAVIASLLLLDRNALRPSLPAPRARFDSARPRESTAPLAVDD